MKNLNSTNFNDFITGDGIKVIDFNAAWCGPCKMMKPEIESLESEMSDIDFGSVDIDAEPQLAMKYKVELIPTILFIKDGQAVSTSVGLKKRDEIRETINSIV